MPKLILASKSPFRKKMLQEKGMQFEVIVSDAEEIADESKSFELQLKEISMAKAQNVFEKTIDQGERIIVAADQNIVFENIMYGKPKYAEEAKQLIKKMSGKEDIFSYVGNTIIHANGNKIMQIINNCDIARMRMDNISDEDIEDYLTNELYLTKCGGMHISDGFLHLEEGRMSTASGMTIEYLQDFLETLWILYYKKNYECDSFQKLLQGAFAFY